MNFKKLILWIIENFDSDSLFIEDFVVLLDFYFPALSFLEKIQYRYINKYYTEGRHEFLKNQPEIWAYENSRLVFGA